MALVGVICEYDPFHLGHEKQLRQIRAQFGPAAEIVCLMSGRFVQRGMPALLPKAVRAEAAVRGGADLVLELPVTRVLQSAEGFAAGGVEILTALGADVLSFGCECGNGAALMELAENMQGPEFDLQLRQALQSGLSYAAARQRAAQALGADGALLQRPNDILALEYCRAIIRQSSRLSPFAVLRAGDYHALHADPENPSATALRARMRAGGDAAPFVPARAAELYRASPRYALAFGERAMLARLRALSPEPWACAAHGSEGLWSKAQRAVHACASYEEIISYCKTRRYPRTRLQRLFLCAYLGLTAQTLAQPVPYVRALAFSPRGAARLKAMRRSAPLPLVNAGQTPDAAAFYALECRAAELGELFCEPERLPRARAEETERVRFVQNDGFCE